MELLLFIAVTDIIVVPLIYWLLGDVEANFTGTPEVVRPAMPRKRRIAVSMLGWLAFFKALRHQDWDRCPPEKKDATVGSFEGIFVDAYRYFVKKQRPWPTY